MGRGSKAFVVSASGEVSDPESLEEELIAFTRENLATYKTARSVEFVGSLPTTATGEVQKYELRAREWEDEERMVGEG